MIIDEIYADVIKRYREKKPEIEITNELTERIWFSIYGVLNHKGEEAARKYAEITNFINEPPTLRELLSHRKESDSSYIDVSRQNPSKPQNTPTIYNGEIDNIPEDMLDLKIIGWVRSCGIYIAE